MDQSQRVEPLETTIRRPLSRFGSRLRSFLELLLALVWRDLTQRYRRSFLGPAWAVLQPLILMVLFNMIRGFVDIPSDGVPYVIFTYSALVPWTFFSNAISLCGPSVYSNAAILKKISLPREVFPLSAIVTALFDFFMSSIILIGMMFWYHVPLRWALLLWIPVLLLITVLLALGAGMMIAALGSFKRDFVFATPFLMQFWMFATPIIYPLSSVPERQRSLIMLNPMVGVIEGFRNVLIKGIPPPTDALLVSLAVTFGLLLVTWPVFRWLSQYFADVM
jgi:lipopolysaccharide transport system permease protein